MTLHRVALLFLPALAGCLAAVDPTEPDRTSVATSELKLVLVPPEDGGPYDICNTQFCADGYVDIRIESDSSCGQGGFRLFCVPCGGPPPELWCR